METQTNKTRKEKSNLSKIVGGVALYSLAFEGAIRMAEAIFPPEYSETIRYVKSGLEIGAGGLALCTSPLWIGYLCNQNYWRKK
jgi:hypothetical protein